MPDDDDRAPDATEGATLPSFELELETFKILHGKMVETARQIDALVLKCSNLLRLAGSVADRSAAARRPASPPPVPMATLDSRPTEKSKGPMRILKWLSQQAGPVSREHVCVDLNISPSTLRTYLPILERKGLVILENGMVRTTLEGIEFAEELPSPTEQTEPSTT